MLTLKTTAKFRKDYKLAKRRGLDLRLLQSVIDDLLAEKILDKNIRTIHCQEITPGFASAIFSQTGS